MDRRQFLKWTAAAGGVVLMPPSMGLIERVRSYFFAPRQGWHADPKRIDELALKHWAVSDITALDLENVVDQIPVLYQRDDVLFRMVASDVRVPVGEYWGIPRTPPSIFKEN